MFNTFSFTLRAVLLASCAVLPAASGNAQALDAPVSDEPFELETIVLSFDRRNEDIQDQPRSVTVLDGDTLTGTEVEAGASIARSTPGLSFSGFGQPGTDFVKIRGVGPLGLPVSSNDQQVAYSVNEVPTSMFGFPPTLFDIQQIEVVRGPQGTTFGRNSLGGGINFVTAPADGERTRRLGFAIGTDGYKTADLVFGDWLVEDSLAARLALRASDYDGDIPNTFNGDTLGSAREVAARLSLAAYTENGWVFETMFQADDQRTNNSFRLHYEHPDFPESGSNRTPETTRDNRQFSFQAQKEFEQVVLTFLTGWQDQSLVNSPGGNDIYTQAAATGLPPEFFIQPDPSYYRDILDDETILSQEIRLSSVETSRISWVAGLNYYRSDYSGQRDQRDDFLTVANGARDVDLDTEAWSVFADATLPVSDRLRLSGGLRYGYEKQSVDGRYVSNGFPGTVAEFRQQSEISDHYTTGRLGLSYDITETVTGYASLARGYSAGGFPKEMLGLATGDQTLAYKPATNDAFEIGLKYLSLDGRYQISAAAFHNRVKDGQILDFAFSDTGVEFFFTNQDYETSGLEIEGAAEILPNLALRGSVALLDSELVNVDPGTASGAVDGNEVPLAPSVSASLAVDYLLEGYRLGIEGDLLIGAQWTFVGSREADIANSWTIPSYSVLDARLSWVKDNMTFTLAANNITDERPVHFAATRSPSTHAVSVGQGRLISAGVTFEF